MPVDLDVVCRSPGSHNIWKSILIQISNDQIFRRHAAVVDCRLAATAPRFILRIIHRDAGTQASLTCFPPTRHELVVSISIKIGATQGVALLYFGVQNTASPQGSRL